MKTKKPFYLKWWFYVIAGLFVVAGISLLAEDAFSGIVGILIGAAMIAFSFMKKKKTSKSSVSIGLPYSFEAAGVFHHKDELISVGSKSRTFDLPNDKFMEKASDGKVIYQYYFNDCTGTLVPDPGNEVDPNAIKVMLNGACVGYVPKNSTGVVANILKQNPTIKVSTRGGPKKYVKDGVIQQENNDFRVFVDMK